MADYSNCDWCGEKDSKLQPYGDTGQMICRACMKAEVEKAEHDEEMRSLKGYTDEERERI